MSLPQPVGVGGILDVAVTLYRRRALALLGAAAVLLVPAGAVQALLAAGTSDIDLAPLLDPVAPSVPPGFDRFLLATSVSLLVGAIASFLAQAACIGVFAGEYEGRPVSGPAALGSALRRGLPVVACGILVTLGTGLGALAFLVPGVWLWVSWYVALPALVVERRGPVAALGRSFALVRPRFWPVLGVALVAAAVSALASYTAGNVAVLLVPGSGTTALAVSSAATTLAAILTVPFTAAVATATYVDLGIRTSTLPLVSPADLA